MTTLDHENFEGAKVLADIGAKIAAGRAALIDLQSSKTDFLNGREAEAIERVKKVLEQSKGLIGEIAQYHSELVGFRNEIGHFADEARNLIQLVEDWKADFDAVNAAKLVEIDGKIKENTELLTKVKAERSLLAGETADIQRRRSLLKTDAQKANDELETLARAKKELNIK